MMLLFMNVTFPAHFPEFITLYYDLYDSSIVWLFIATTASSTHRPHLQYCCKNAR